jgi:hypothetical protein
VNERLIDTETTVRSPAKELTRLTDEEPKSKDWQKRSEAGPEARCETSVNSDAPIALVLRVARGSVKEGTRVVASQQVKEDPVEEIVRRYRDILAGLAKY